MPCCCCCHFDEDLNVLGPKASRQLRALETQCGLTRDPHPYTLEPNAAKVARRRSTPVYLNTYHLITDTTNLRLHKIGMGMFHSGVEVGPWEYSFGEPADDSIETGVFHTAPMQAMGNFYRRIYLGDTTVSAEQLQALLLRVKMEWPAHRYEVLHRNCNHFARYFCKKLSTTTPLLVPRWVNRIANWGDVVIPRCIAAWAIRRMDDGPPKAMSLKDRHKLREKQREEQRREQQRRWEERKTGTADGGVVETDSAGPRPRLARSDAVCCTTPKPGREIAMPNFNAGREPPAPSLSPDRRSAARAALYSPTDAGTPVSHGGHELDVEFDERRHSQCSAHFLDTVELTDVMTPRPPIGDHTSRPLASHGSSEHKAGDRASLRETEAEEGAVVPSFPLLEDDVECIAPESVIINVADGSEAGSPMGASQAKAESDGSVL